MQQLIELQLQNIENNFEVIFNHAPVGMIALDSEGTINQINDAALQMTKKSREQVIGFHFGECYNCNFKYGGCSRLRFWGCLFKL